MEASLPRDWQSAQLYPVSMVWQPPFTQLVDLIGHGDMQVRHVQWFMCPCAISCASAKERPFSSWWPLTCKEQ